MDTKALLETIHYQSKVSFQPLLTVLKRTLNHTSSAGAKKLYSGILDYADQHPELQQAIDDLSVLDSHHEWIEMLLSVIFPPTASEHEMVYAVSRPYSFSTIYASRLFRLIFLDPGTNDIKI